MQVLSGPLAEGALFLRHVDSFLPLWMFGLLFFLSVCLLLLQLIIYFSWKLRQGEHDIKISCPVHIQRPDYVIFTVALRGCINTVGRYHLKDMMWYKYIDSSPYCWGSSIKNELQKLGQILFFYFFAAIIAGSATQHFKDIMTLLPASHVPQRYLTAQAANK